jgi:hypothetical protein
MFLRVVALILVLLMPSFTFAADPVGELQTKIRTGAVKLDFDAERGYLASLLKILRIPISSQTLVFSKTSLQSERISPRTPRALYFNDDVYVAWVQGASFIEIMSVDPKTGAAFYLLPQEKTDRPQFERSTGHECSVCHYDQAAAPKFVPRLMVSSVIPDSTGNVEGAVPIDTTDRTPLNERWGGWYVTGTHGNQKHLGNTVLQKPTSAFAPLMPSALQTSLNVTDLSGRIDARRYLSPYSDIVALMVLTHQADVQNLIAAAALKPAKTAKDAGEPLVKAMLFSGAAPLTSPVKGTSAFTMEFSKEGPRDSRGRSLRDFDLNTRLFRYPLSYLIYSRPFDQIPPDVKTYVYRRLHEVLTGQDKSPDFAHLSAVDRTAILEILRQTKADFARSEK